MEINHFDASSKNMSQEDLRRAFQSVEDAYLRDRIAEDYPDYNRYLEKTEGPIIRSGKKKGQRDASKVIPSEKKGCRECFACLGGARAPEISECRGDSEMA